MDRLALVERTTDRCNGGPGGRPPPILSDCPGFRAGRNQGL